MSPVWVTKQQSAPNIDPGTYDLELANVREVQIDDFELTSEKTPRIELAFTIRTIHSGTARSSPTSAPRGWVQRQN